MRELVFCCSPTGNCFNKVTWIRHTQFAGDHPFCEKHARLEKDFADNPLIAPSSYVDWEKVD